ncbi:MAG: hypothetical protein WD737_12845 [Gemmatimonadota bacterium]
MDHGLMSGMLFAGVVMSVIPIIVSIGIMVAIWRSHMAVRGIEDGSISPPPKPPAD